MSEAVAVSIEEVRRIAELANLDLTPEEEPRMQRDLNAILEHFLQLNELDTAGVAPMAQVADGLAVEADQTGADLRPDQVRPSLDRREVMLAAPDTDGRFFRVPKVIER